MREILNEFESITLDEMRGIKLMNRIDTKFVTTVPMLRRLLELAKGQYYVQEQGGLRISPYYTLYFDTEDCKMYHRHEAGHLARQKVRVRSYVNAGLNFLEVKTKNNHGRTKKKRVEAVGFDPRHIDSFDVTSTDYETFLRTYLNYDQQSLVRQMENHFDRITLVNKAKTERLTIDTNLRFHNMTTGNDRVMDNLVVIELKRDGLQPSPVLPMLSQLRIFPHGFSKYCIGSALTNESLRRNRIKPRLHSVEKIMALR